MKNEEFDKLEVLLRQKYFADLSPDEKLFVEEQIGGERAYLDLFTMINQAKATKTRSVSSSTKRKLTSKFKQKHQSFADSWINFKLPVYVNLPVAVLIVVIIWVSLPAKVVQIDKIVTVQLPSKADTILVYSPSDTIYIEKKIHIKVPVYITKNEEKQPKEQPKILGSTLAEQQGLTDLLVSGK